MRILALAIVFALMLVPAVGRAKERVERYAKPRLSAAYRSIDVRRAPVLVRPETPATDCVDSGCTPQPFDIADPSRLPAAPDVLDPGSLRGPPRR